MNLECDDFPFQSSLRFGEYNFDYNCSNSNNYDIFPQKSNYNIFDDKLSDVDIFKETIQDDLTGYTPTPTIFDKSSYKL